VRLPVPRAIERLGALQAQWPPSPYIALWSRIDGFRKEQLMRAVERRAVVKATLMRETLHLVSSSDYLAYAGLFTSARTARIERVLAKEASEVDVDELARELVRHATAKPRSRPELLDLLGRPRLGREPRPWHEWHVLTAKAGLVHTPSGSAWRHRTGGSRYAPAASWLGADGRSDDDARRHLVRRYLAAYGPASRADVAQWTGLAIGALEPAFSDRALALFRDEQGRELLDVPRAPLPSPDTVAPVRFLPPFENCLLAHADRNRILSDEHRKLVIRGGDVRPTLLVDGVVVGTWNLVDGVMELEPFEPLTRSIRRELEREARALAAFYG
jgi:Winged helix DNA-binding domain